MISKIKKHPILTLVIPSIFICLIYIFSNRKVEYFKFWAELMEFLYDLSIWVIAAGVFYYFQLYIPEQRKKDIVIENFKKYWEHTKDNLISALLYTSYSQDLLFNLRDYSFFREYFNAPHDTIKWQTRWDWVLNNLTERKIQTILTEFESLAKEIDFLLREIQVDNDEVFSLLKRLQGILHRHKTVDQNFGEEKALSLFLWEILWSWSTVKWPRDYDFMKEKIINKI